MSAVRLTPILTYLLVAWFVADVGGRLLPVEWLHILPEHVATRSPGRYSPFIPNLNFLNDSWTGETAMTGNLKPTETRPAVHFSTDAWGYRATPGVPPGAKFDLILHDGASFAYGGGLSDNETLPAVVSSTTGLKMYNGGHFFWDPPGVQCLDDLLAKTEGQKPTVVLLEWEQFDHDLAQLDGRPWRLDGPGKALLGAERYTQLRGDLQFAKRYLNAVWNISPLEVLSIRLFKSLSNDVILPNRYRQAVEARTLPGGQRILFLTDEVRRTMHPPTEKDVLARAQYFSHYQQLLAARKLDLYVVLLPNKYTLYGTLIDGVSPPIEPPYLDRLEIAISKTGVKVVNMLPELRRQAAAELASGELSYYREDHHWSPRGVRAVAAALAARYSRESPHVIQ